MYRFLFCLIATSLMGHAQPALRRDETTLKPLLGFEAEPQDGFPGGWRGSTGAVFSDEQTVHSGARSVRIERDARSTGAFSGVVLSLPVDFGGEVIELRGFARTEGVKGAIGLWLRQDGNVNGDAFATTEGQNVGGTTDWVEYSVKLRRQVGAESVAFGFLLTGTGKAWVDDLQLLVDGKPVWVAPKWEREPTVLNRDHEFDRGSGIVSGPLSPVQIENLAALGRVWGFLKYHHPKVTSGGVHWDYELFRILPEILTAGDRAAANAAMLHWVDALGPVQAGEFKAALPSDVHLAPDTDWFKDEAAWGSDLSQRLRAIHDNRPAREKQFYVSLVHGVGNPEFSNELAYPNMKSGDAGFQLLALYRYWNVIRYWFPYRDLIGENWDAVLTEYVPKVMGAANGDDYRRVMLTLIARVHDTHANLWNGLSARPPGGDHQLPITVRFVGSKAVIAGVLPGAVPSPFRPGDIIESIDGVEIERLLRDWAPYYAASNDPTRLRDIARNLTQGPEGEARVVVTRDGQQMKISAPRVPTVSIAKSITFTHDLPGDAFRLLSPDVAYVKLSAAKDSDVKDWVRQAAGTKGLIIDIRNYPSAFVVFTLGQLLVDQPVEFVRFTVGDPATPGVFGFGHPLKLQPQEPRYRGRIAILVDEVSQSNAEYTTMAFRTAPGAVVVGSTTAGADGNVSRLSLPGGLNTMISGIGVFYPDKRPTQRIGIVPDVEVRPTVAGLREGRDEVLEEAVRQILGPEIPASEVRKRVPAVTGVSGIALPK